MRDSDISHSDYCDGTLDDDGVCEACEERHKAEAAYWRPLWEGEKAAGLHGEFTEERYLSLDDAREMGGYDSSDLDGQGSWSGTPARFK